jgi:hypothetical protein
METHGVEATRVAPPVTEDILMPWKPAGPLVRNALTVLPFLALGLAYVATQYAAYLKVQCGTQAT